MIRRPTRLTIDRAFFLYADTQWIRDQQREVLYDRVPK